MAPVGVAVSPGPAAPALTASAQSAESECPPLGNRFQASWETVDGAPGEVARRFGTLSWTRSRLDYDIRAGYPVYVCLASSAEAGLLYTQEGSLRGSQTGTWPFQMVTEVGFVAVEVTDQAGTGVLPPTGVRVPLRVAGLAVGAVLAGWWLSRTGPGARKAAAQA